MPTPALLPPQRCRALGRVLPGRTMQVSYLFFHHRCIHVRDQADGKFSYNSARYDCFSSGLIERALDPMDGKRRVPP